MPKSKPTAQTRPNPTEQDFQLCARTSNNQRVEIVQGGSNHYCRDAYDTYVKKGNGPVFSLSQQIKTCKFNEDPDPTFCGWKALGELLSSPTKAPNYNNPRDSFWPK